MRKYLRRFNSLQFIIYILLDRGTIILKINYTFKSIAVSTELKSSNVFLQHTYNSVYTYLLLDTVIESIGKIQ